MHVRVRVCKEERQEAKCGRLGCYLGGQKQPGRARERRGGWLATVVEIMQEKEKGGGRDGRGGARADATRKNWEGRAQKPMSERAECEGVTRGTTGRQKKVEASADVVRRGE